MYLRWLPLVIYIDFKKPSQYMRRLFCVTHSDEYAPSSHNKSLRLRSVCFCFDLRSSLFSGWDYIPVSVNGVELQHGKAGQFQTVFRIFQHFHEFLRRFRQQVSQSRCPAEGVFNSQPLNTHGRQDSIVHRRLYFVYHAVHQYLCCQAVRIRKLL